MPTRRGHRPRLQLDAHIKARFAQMTNKILNPTLRLLFSRRVLGKVRGKLSDWLGFRWLGGGIHGDRFFVKRFQPIDLCLLLESIDHRGARARSHLGEKALRMCDFLHGIGQRNVIFLRHEETTATVLERFRDATVLRRRHWQTGRHRFEK